MMPAGRYFVGDLSLVLENEWSEISRLSILSRYRDGGEFILPSGKIIAVYEVPDNGVYVSSQGTKHKVKSLTFGCCKVKHIQNDFHESQLERIGSIIDFTEPFTTFVRRDSIVIGHIVIDISE